MKAILISFLPLLLYVSCSSNTLDQTKYYTTTKEMPLIENDNGFIYANMKNIGTGAKVMLLQNKVDADGYVKVVTDIGHDFGILKIEDLKITDLEISFPKKQVFLNNTSEIFYVRNNNSSSDATFRNSYQLLCILQSETKKIEVRNDNSGIIQSLVLGNSLGYKFIDINIDLNPLNIGNNKLLLVAIDKKNNIIGKREFHIEKENISAKVVNNNQLDTFRYKRYSNEILIERFFGYSENDEDIENYRPDFNKYVITGSDDYSYNVGVLLDKTKYKRSDIPLTLSILRNNKEITHINIRQYELTPSYNLFCKIVEYPKIIVIYCTPPFEGPSRIIIFNKTTNDIYDIWTLLRRNNISNFHNSFVVSVGDFIKITEIPFHFDFSDKDYVNYIVDENTDKIIRIENK